MANNATESAGANLRTRMELTVFFSGDAAGASTAGADRATLPAAIAAKRPLSVFEPVPKVIFFRFVAQPSVIAVFVPGPDLFVADHDPAATYYDLPHPHIPNRCRESN